MPPADRHSDDRSVIDNSVLNIDAIEPQDRRSIPTRVAGPTALLIAKAHKINDRLAETGRPDRMNDKDASEGPFV